MKRRIVLIVAVVGAVAALAGCAGQDSVIFSGGQGRTADGLVLVDKVLALSGPSGDSAGGQVSFEIRIDTPSGPRYVLAAGPVTCLAVHGNSAVIKFDPQLAGLGIVEVDFQDANPDTISFFHDNAQNPDDCSGVVSSGQPLLNGQISIVDSQPPPPTR